MYTIKIIIIVRNISKQIFLYTQYFPSSNIFFIIIHTVSPILNNYCDCPFSRFQAVLTNTCPPPVLTWTCPPQWTCPCPLPNQAPSKLHGISPCLSSPPMQPSHASLSLLSRAGELFVYIL